jgi:microcystin-dependent protein|tara:strand:+ start:42 stop:617 length:576 start_codon:yes stop_codon:yes gene_type:complete
MSNYEATKYDYTGANLTGIEGIPTGCIIPWSDTSIPTGFLECDGQSVSRTTYAALFAIISTTYGSADGSSFNVPDLGDNVAVGRSGTKTIATTGGANTVTATGSVGGSTAAHTLSESELAAHSHSIPNLFVNHAIPRNHNIGDGSHAYWSTPSTTSAGSDSGHSHNMSANFSGDATSVVQPYLAILYLIKT